ncbi:MAG: DMT family transporter [Rhizobiaceae bacterium]|nr:DMT family transporter [Rhizobiaceae bacterium]
MQLQHRTGLGVILALTGGLLISLDIPVIRLAGGDPWIVMLCRGLGLTLVLGYVLVFRKNWTQTPRDPFDNPKWVEVGIYYGITSIMFTLAVFNTSAANLVFILAFNPMIAALFAWWLFGERPGPATCIAIVLTIAGVAIIVGEGLQGGTIKGDLAALLAAMFLALSLVRCRQSGQDMSLSGCLGGMIAALFALPMAIAYSTIPDAPWWLALNVLVMVPASGFTLQLAPRFIPAAQVSMFFLLETVLAPVWIWLIFRDVPSANTILGGAIVLGAIAGHSVWQLRTTNRITAPTA